MASTTKQKIRDPSKLVPRTHPKYRDWLKFLSSIKDAAHRFNSEKRSAAEAADYLVGYFDHTARALLETVGDYASALKCGTELDNLVPEFLAWYRAWVRAAALTRSKPSRKEIDDLRKRLLRRAEHWKAEAHATRVPLPKESAKQRAERRQRELEPLLRKARITTDDVWAERAGATMDRNTPRDYRTGKTARLRKTTRQALAQALGILEIDLPD